MTWQSEPLLPGTAKGPVLRLSAPISFWGGVDPATSEIVAGAHPQRGTRIDGTILVLPGLIGSSSSSSILLELLHNGRAPLALVLAQRDAILPMAVVVSRQMGWATIPVVLLPGSGPATGDRVELDASGLIRLEAAGKDGP